VCNPSAILPSRGLIRKQVVGALDMPRPDQPVTGTQA
jgi:hypothetical protein